MVYPPANAANTNPANAGAKLPISYDINSVKGAKIFVAPNGKNSNSGSINSPLATLERALSVVPSGGTIILRNGTYREGSISVGKSVTIQSYPGEVAEFRGSKKYSSSDYNPIPVTDGSGISFTSGQNLTGDGVGKYPDQAWNGNTQLKQVSSRDKLTSSSFYVDRGAEKLYLHSSVDKDNVEVSSKRVFMTINASNVRLKGIKVTRYSNTAEDQAAIRIVGGADNSLLENVYISDTSFIAVQYAGSKNLNRGSSMKNVTITKSNWMGIGALYTDNLTLDAVALTNMNHFGEFKTSPQSGALKTSRARYTKVINSLVSNNNGHGLWFDQSNYDVDVANNRIVNNSGSGVFFEISDDLLLINNYIKAKGGARAVKLSGSSGLKLVNNTIIGGADTVGIYVDPRSKPGCAKPGGTKCTTEYSSDTDTVRPWIDTIDWIPRIDYMVNNIVAYPTSGGYCGGVVGVCIMSSNNGAKVAIETVIHKADSSRGIPQTYINGNVYANGGNNIITTAVGSFKTTSAFGDKMAGKPVKISGLEDKGKYGNKYVNPDGTVTAALNHAEAVALPSNGNINNYISAGTKHFGIVDSNSIPSSSVEGSAQNNSVDTTPLDGKSADDALADTGSYSCDGVSTEACLKNNPIIKAINTGASFLVGIIGLLAIIRIIFAGLQYSAARDNPQALADARKAIYNVVLGLVAFVFLYAFMQWLIPGGVF